MRTGAKHALFRNTALLGTALTLLNTFIAVGADALGKTLIGTYAAPQLIFLSGLIAIAVLLVIGRFVGYGDMLRTGAPKAMAARAVAGIISVTCFFNAFHYLPFAEVFIFVAIMPILSAVLSMVFLGEKATSRTWVALVIGCIGLMCMFPSGIHSMQIGHLIGALASVSGTISVVLSRRICRHNTHSLAQVFYQQVANVAVMAIALPQVAQAMPLHDFILLVGYAVLVLTTRWLMVIAVRLLPAFIVMQIVNVQFLWMVILGKVLFRETTPPYVFLGVGLVIVSGIYLVSTEIFGKFGKKAVNKALSEDLRGFLPRKADAQTES